MLRTAVLYYAKPSGQAKLKVLAEALAEGMKKQGARVDVINGAKAKETRLTGYHYIAVGCDVRSWFKGELPPELIPSLNNGGIITGKNAFAFVPSASVGTNSTLLKLMNTLEHKGMHLRYSEVLANADAAEALGQGLKLD